MAAVEATASGVRWTFSPMLDIARDCRWGRVAEGSGEDPYLDMLMGVTLAPGESKMIKFELPVSELAFWNIDMEYVVEPGDFRLWVGGDSDAGDPVEFVVK